MDTKVDHAVAIVGVGAVLPDAPDAPTFWENVKAGRYSVKDVPADRWDADLYYDPDPAAPDKTYSRIGGWVDDYGWDPLGWRLPIPPKVAEVMDLTQKWAITTARAALNDYGFPDRALDPERTAVILGNAMGGDMHLLTATRILFPEVAQELAGASSFKALPPEVRGAVLEELQAGVRRRIPDITEDTMPGELANIIAGRVAALYNFRGPNYVTDAACASAMAAMSAAIEGLEQHDYDAVLTGGIDANMSPSTFVKFSKIGALSATGTRPYAEGADGFVMGEGAACFLLKRLEDAERDGDRVYAVIRAFGGSSDGKGKGITAPNPIGQQLAVRRAWERVGLVPEPGDLVEGHGTSTRVGDVVEVEAMSAVFAGLGLPVGSVALGSVKSNIGHLKGAAGAAGILKTALSLHHKTLPPSINFHAPNPGIDFSRSPFRVNTETVPWEKPGTNGVVRRAGVSAFGFGGTNFHAVLEEHVPGRLTQPRGYVQGAELAEGPRTSARAGAGNGGAALADGSGSGVSGGGASLKAPLRGALVIGGATEAEVAERLRAVKERAAAGVVPEVRAPDAADLEAPVRVAIDWGDADELASLAEKTLEALESGEDGRWRALRNKGVYLGRGAPGKVAFLFTGQGSQYINMLQELRREEPIVAETFAEADAVMTPLLGGTPLTEHIFFDDPDEATLAAAEEGLKHTAITQPAVLTVDTALSRLLGAYGIRPDMVMGHSLGEYGALVAAGAMELGHALKAVSARGKAMESVALDDNGLMAAVFGPVDRIEDVLDGVDGYVVVANINSSKECVIGGATEAVEAAVDTLKEAGLRAQLLPVSHAFHTDIVAPASVPLLETLHSLDLQPPRLPVVANISGDFYPTGEDALERMLEILGRQIGSPVQFVKGLETLYQAGARVFIEVGPRRSLYGFVEDVLGEKDDVTALFTNHPRNGDVVSVNRALCGLYAAGLGNGVEREAGEAERGRAGDRAMVVEAVSADAGSPSDASAPPRPLAPSPPQGGGGAGVATGVGNNTLLELGKLFADFLDRGMEIYKGGEAPRTGRREPAPPPARPRIGITGASLGLPGTERVFDEGHIASILGGGQFIRSVSDELRRAMASRGITRLVKGVNGEARFEVIDQPEDVIKLYGRGGELDLEAEYGFPEDRLPALDRVTRLAIAAGLDALRDAGIPLVMRYKTTTTGSKLPDGWALPESMRDDTGVILASAWPGLESLTEIIEGYHEDLARRQRLEELESVRGTLNGDDSAVAKELDGRIAALREEVEAGAYTFDRRFLFRVLNMGHAQFAEYIGARGPNIGTNGACASTTQAVGLARDWIETGRCRRVIVLSADDPTTDRLFPWFGSAFLASGTAATDERVEDAAIPFDRRRHGLIVGMGGASLVVERLDASAERGLQPICEILGSVVANSAFHGSRLDVDHIVDVMERLVSGAEAEWGLDRHELAGKTVFVSHETYTPARGGSASAEVAALRAVFGPDADAILVANTKGYTGHAMGVGIEDTLAVKMLETGIVPPVANFRDVDPDLGSLNLSPGGSHPRQYALRLGAGFGSQIAMSLLRWTPPPDGARRSPDDLGYHHRIADHDAWAAWLRAVTGYDAPELEVERRTLRVRHQGQPPRAPVPVYTPAVAPRVDWATAAPPAKAPTPAEAGTPTPPLAPSPTREGKGVADAPSPGRGGGVEAGVARRVIELVAEQTGYPEDMLELDLDLEADLGIDTVKQAEMFAAIRGEWGIERDDNLALRDYPTLNRAIEFVYEKRPDLRPAEGAPQPEGGAGEPADGMPAEAGTVAGAAAEAGAVAGAASPADAGTPTPPLAPSPTREGKGVADAPSPGRGGEAGTGADPVARRVIELVAEQTGYPEDMLELDLDLEADLGIDTVKQAEMFAAIRGEWGIERDDNLALRDYPTLARAIEFVYEKRPDLRPAEGAPEAEGGGRETAGGMPAEAGAVARAASPADAGTPTPPLAPSPTREGKGVAVRRIPVPRLRPGLGLFRSTNVELGDGARVVVMPDQGGVGKALVDRLEKRGVDVLVVDDAPAADELAERLAAWSADGPVRGVYWLAALDALPEPEKLAVAERREALRRRVKLLYTTMRTLYDQVGETGTFLVSATRLGGRHGYDAPGANDTLGGAVVGFTKAFKRERPDALVKAVDFAPSRKTAALADLLIAETLTDAGVMEIGYAEDERWMVGLEERPAGAPALELGPDTVYLVTGAAGSITSAIIGDLAAAGGTFHLLDLTPAPDPGDADLARLESDRDGLKRDIFERMKAAGERATPAAVEKRLAALERSAAALASIRAVDAGGGTAHYHGVNLLDADAMAGVMAKVVETSGRVDVLVHAAGLEISRSLPDKSPEEFDLVFDVKTDGWLSLLAGLGDAPLGAAVVFSSIAGRFGNAGQADYSAANDMLCKAVSAFRTTRPETRGIAIDWTAWADIGMASRGSIPVIMEAAGIDMLPPAEGIPVVRRELESGTRSEVVVAGSLGVMLAGLDETGGLDTARVKELPGADAAMIGEVRGLDVVNGLVVETELDPMVQPFLYDHQIGGTPVLPGVMGLEAMAEAARLLFPDRHVAAVEDVDFHSPFKFYRSEPRTITVQAVFGRELDDVVARCRLMGARTLHGRDEPEVTTHFTATVRLAVGAPAQERTRQLPAADDVVAADTIYQLYFHGPAYRVLDGAWRAGHELAGRFALELPPNQEPASAPTLVAPRLVELCFQTAGLAELAGAARMGLPYHIDRLELLRPPAEEAGLTAVVTANGGDAFDAEVADGQGRVHLTLTGYRTMALPESVDATPLAALRQEQEAMA